MEKNKEIMAKISDSEKGANESMQSTQNQLNKALAERDTALAEIQDLNRAQKEYMNKIRDLTKSVKHAKEREEIHSK